MKTIAELRKEIYDYHRKYYAYIFEEWKWYSYRKFNEVKIPPISASLKWVESLLH